MGTLFIAYLIWILAAIMTLIMERFREQSKRVDTLYRKMEKKLFYNGLLSLFVESYSLTIVGCLTLI